MQLMASFSEKYWPSLLWFIIKLMLYLVLPATAGLGIAFGAWLEWKYIIFEEYRDWLAPKLGIEVENEHYD